MRTFINKIKGNFPAFLNVISALAKKKIVGFLWGDKGSIEGPECLMSS